MNRFTFGLNSGMHAYMMVVKHQWWKPFIKQTQDPQAVQRALLERILTTQAQTIFGKKHRFSRLRGYHEFRLGVPIHTYEDLRPSIHTQEDMKVPQLNNEQPVRYAMTSGTTGNPKIIPMLHRTNQMLRHYQRLSTYAQYQGIPRIFQGKMLVISGQEIEGYLESGSPYGSMSGMLSASLPSVLQAKRFLPEAIHGISDYQQKYLYLTAWALSEPDLSVVATANPSTFLKLLEMGREHFSQLVEQLEVNCKKDSDGVLPFPRPTRRRLRDLQSFLGHEDQLTVDFVWHALGEISTAYNVFVHLVDNQGTIIAQSDAGPANWTRPSTGWASSTIRPWSGSWPRR